ncbi:MAG: hypothetical protein H6673_16320 [Anaerolineales bacterium]|nr:hypothetical protein [Anaerolineales bacterium]
MKKFTGLLVVLILLAMALPLNAQDPLKLEVLGPFSHGASDKDTSEIAAFDPTTMTLFIVKNHMER